MTRLSWRMAWRIARRGLDWRFRGLRLLVACLVLGAAALSAIGTLTGAIDHELTARGAVMLGGSRIDPRLIASVLVGFVGVALVLRPTIDRDQFWHGLAGLCSGVLSATAYLQVTALGRSGEPEYRIVFYFSMGGAIAGLLTTLALKAVGQGGSQHGHSATGIALLLAVGLLATVAQLMMTRAYARGKTLVNASLQYSGILFSFVYGVLLFSDPVTLWAVAGITLIVAAGLSATLLRAKTTPVDSQNHAITES